MKVNILRTAELVVLVCLVSVTLGGFWLIPSLFNAVDINAVIDYLNSPINP